VSGRRSGPIELLQKPVLGVKRKREELAVGDFFPGMIVGKLDYPDRKGRGGKKGVPNSAKFPLMFLTYL
jgi:hypothetical protein